VRGCGAGRVLNPQEKAELDWLWEAHENTVVASGLNQLAGEYAILPTFSINSLPWGVGGSTSFGGSNLSALVSFVSGFFRSIAEIETYEAGRSAKIGGYVRREQEWAYQSHLAMHEINQVLKQLCAAQLREAIAGHEISVHEQQMRNAAEIEEFLSNERKGKKTSQALYAWMSRETRGLYDRMFQLAYDVAKKAERALQQEIGDPNATFLTYGYTGGREGLLAGDRLLADVRRMEVAYHDLNRRELELTKHVSLLQLDPIALLKLKRSGSCTIRLPEELFDIDGAGHYFRRIKSVAVSVPCVVGPYTSLRCTLTRLKSSIRTVPTGDYERSGDSDARFSDFYGSLESVVTSTGQNDTGLFETNLRDDRYLPFEGSGVISEWQIDLPREFKEFDYETITDIILHIRFTARQGGEALRKRAEDSLRNKIQDASGAGAVRMFSLRHEFPAEWAAFQAQQASKNPLPFAQLSFELLQEHYPFWTQGREGHLEEAQLYVLPSSELAAGTSLAVAKSSANPSEGETDKLSLIEKGAPLEGLLFGALDKAKPEGPFGTPDPLNPDKRRVNLFFEKKIGLEDVWLALKCSWKD
jgi:hypothetical protein